MEHNAGSYIHTDLTSCQEPVHISDRCAGVEEESVGGI